MQNGDNLGFATRQRLAMTAFAARRKKHAIVPKKPASIKINIFIKHLIELSQGKMKIIHMFAPYLRGQKSRFIFYCLFFRHFLFNLAKQGFA